MKIKNPKQQPRWMVALYVAMGWTLLFILPAMIRNIPVRGLWFILAGGLSYTIGDILFMASYEVFTCNMALVCNWWQRVFLLCCFVRLYF